MIEQHAVADAHLLEHEIARLVVAHTAPGGLLPRRSEHVVDGALVGLRFHQPVFHCFFLEKECPPLMPVGPASEPCAKQGGRLPVTSGSSGTPEAGAVRKETTRGPTRGRYPVWKFETRPVPKGGA